MKFSIKDFFSKCDKIRRKLLIWSHLLKKIVNGKLHFLCSVRITLCCQWDYVRSHRLSLAPAKFILVVINKHSNLQNKRTLMNIYIRWHHQIHVMSENYYSHLWAVCSFNSTNFTLLGQTAHGISNRTLLAFIWKKLNLQFLSSQHYIQAQSYFFEIIGKLQ